MWRASMAAAGMRLGGVVRLTLLSAAPSPAGLADCRPRPAESRTNRASNTIEPVVRHQTKLQQMNVILVLACSYLEPYDLRKTAAASHAEQAECGRPEGAAGRQVDMLMGTPYVWSQHKTIGAFYSHSTNHKAQGGEGETSESLVACVYRS
jgi:hypothetical protein